MILTRRGWAVGRTYLIWGVCEQWKSQIKRLPLVRASRPCHHHVVAPGREGEGQIYLL